MNRSDRVLRVQSMLTDRDHTLLSWLYDHGVLTSEQIAHALFPSLNICQRRLLRLTSADIIGRFRPQKPDGGSYPYHYVINQLGAEIVAAQRREPPPRPGHARERRHHLTARANLPHLLGINQFFIDLAGYARTYPTAGARLERWWPAAKMQHADAFDWHDSWAMLDVDTRVRPDAHGIWSEHGLSVPFCLEHDTGTEPLRILVDKVAHYMRFMQATRRPWPVLFWLPTTARELHLHHRLATEYPSVTIPVATAARDYQRDRGLSPAEDVWWLHGRTGARLRLADLPPPPADPEPDATPVDFRERGW